MSARRVLIGLLALALVGPAACGSSTDGPAAAVDASEHGGDKVEHASSGDDGETFASTSTTLAASPKGEAPQPSGSAPRPMDAAAAREVYVPPAGRYVYDTSGFTESGSGATRRRSEPPPETTDEVTVTRQGSGIEVRTATSYGSSGQETSVLVDDDTAHLTRLTYRSTNAGVATEQAVTPQPPILVARLPYVVGDRWESAWRDATLGIQGVGWGAVVRRETVSVGAGSFDTVVLQLHQRLQGSISGELDITSWIDPSTGIVVRQVLITDLQDATGASHSEITRTLR